MGCPLCFKDEDPETFESLSDLCQNEVTSWLDFQKTHRAAFERKQRLLESLIGLNKEIHQALIDVNFEHQDLISVVDLQAKIKKVVEFYSEENAKALLELRSQLKELQGKIQELNSQLDKLESKSLVSSCVENPDNYKKVKQLIKDFDFSDEKA